MPIGKLWAGRAYGTNIGNLFLTLDGDDRYLTGVLRFNENDSDLLKFELEGNFDGSTLTLNGQGARISNEESVGSLKLSVSLDNSGALRGTWNTTLGNAGTLELHPHDRQVKSEALPLPSLFIARHDFAAIQVDKDNIIYIANVIQSEFLYSKVIISVTQDSERATFLDDFRSRNFHKEKARIVRIFASAAEQSGVSRSATVEFGPRLNFVTTQSSDEAWSLGMKEKLRSDIHNFEHSYATKLKKINVGVNQFLLILTIVCLPGISSIVDRAILVSGVLIIAGIVMALHDKYLPHAQIYLSPRSPSVLARMGPPVLSWIISLTASVAAALLAAYLQGLMHIPVLPP